MPTGTTLADAVDVEAKLARLLPADLRPLFDRSFIRSHLLHGEFVYRLVLGIGGEVGLDGVLRTPATAAEIAAAAGLDAAQSAVPLDWMLRLLACRGVLEARAGEVPRYHGRLPWPVLDPGRVRDEQMRHDPSWAPAYALAETVARDYAAFLRGQVSGEDVLFAPRRLRLWVDYFSNDNGLYAVNNRLGALAAAAWMPRSQGSTVLELGAGLGSGAVALLEQLAAAGRSTEVTAYRFTELVSAFLRRGEQVVRGRFPDLAGLRAETLDIERPFGDQRVEPGSVGLVYAVNTLHVARDLAFTLAEVRRALAPGGWLIASECMRAAEPTYAEFVFNLTKAFRSPERHPASRRAGGFLAPAEWRDVLEAAGFADVRFLPDIARVREQVPDFLVAAVGGRRAA